MTYKKLVALTVTVAVIGCSNNPVSDSGDNTGSTPKFQISTSQSAKREVVAGTDSRIAAQAKSNNEFAVKLYSELTKGENSGNSNLFFSPFSIVSALGMADVGAVDETDRQIRTALQVQLPGEDFHAALNGLDQSLETVASTAGNLQLKNVNSIWAQNGFPLKLLYLDRLTQHYGAGINLLNFIEKPDSSRIIINDWVSEQTNNRINNLLPEGSINVDTRLVLTNAIYFLADWVFKFDVSNTTEKQFARKDGQTVTVPMMVLRKTDEITREVKNMKHFYGRVDSTRILELPYIGNRLVMDILLPDSGTFDTFESGLSMQGIDALINSLDSVFLPPVQIPRFEFTTGSVSLKNALVNLGMSLPFTMSADFSGISKSKLFIDNVIHKAFIKVDENGTEAAAATGVIFATTSAAAPKVFIADRPFIYMIRDTQTKSILFMGRVLDPTVTE